MIHKIENVFLISTNNTWKPGVFDSRKTANYAFRFSDEDLQKIQNSHDLITYEILKEFKKTGEMK